MRKINYTSEVLIIQKGKMKVDIYSERKKYLFSKTLFKDDIKGKPKLSTFFLVKAKHTSPLP